MIKNPQAGDIVLVRGPGHSNLFCLFDTSHSKYVQGILIHTTWEDATDMDVVLKHPGVGGPSPLPYPLVLCCDLYGQILRTQVARKLAHLDFPVGHPLLKPDEIAEALDGYRGLPIWRNTPRWNEKIRLLEEELQPLTRPFWQGFRW
jgi:hypothetical protein